MSDPTKETPLIPAEQRLPELTFKVIVFAILLAVILAGANAYLALKIGMTISASIPASVLAIGILRFFKNSNVLECNIIQTSASAGEGIAAAVSFILPALIILRFWQGFPYWETTLLTLVGGVLGVLFSVPLRRVLLHLPTLRFPEGTAIGQVLKISASSSSSERLRALVHGGAFGAIVAFLQTGLQVVANSVQLFYATPRLLFGFAIGFNPATLAAGFIIGVEVAISLLVGIVVGWLVIMPAIAWHFGVPAGNSYYEQGMQLWAQHLRYVGVGTMLLGGIWTLVRLVKPIVTGVTTAFRELKQMKREQTVMKRTEFDIPIHFVVIISGLLSIVLFGLVYHFLGQTGLAGTHGYQIYASLCITLFVVIVGFLLATVCGYFTGLVGSSNNPLSGLIIVGILLLGIIFLGLFNLSHGKHALHAAILVIEIMTIVAAVAAISNENIQDLKAGYMVGATPWKQQFILIVGAVSSALVIGPVLQLLYQAYGMGGVYPRSGMDPTQTLAAPQASLMAALSRGVLSLDLDWWMIGVGLLVAVVIIAIDEYLTPRGRRLPSLAVGLGIYLPPAIMVPVVIGGFVNFLSKSALKRKGMVKDQVESHLQNGILLACGLVAGSAIMGVLLAIPFVIFGSADIMAILGKNQRTLTEVTGLIILLLLIGWLFRICQPKNKGSNGQ